MKKRLLIGAVLAVGIPCVVLAGGDGFGDGLTLESGIDFNPGDGFMEQGSPSNPYVVRDGSGRDTGMRVRTRGEDFTPGDGFMDQGTVGNPYVIERVTPWD